MRRVRKGGVYHQCDAHIESRLRGWLISMVVRDLNPNNCGIFQGTSFKSFVFITSTIYPNPCIYFSQK